MHEPPITYTTWTEKPRTPEERQVEIADPRAIRFDDGPTLAIEIRPDKATTISRAPHPLVIADYGADGELNGISLSGPAAEAVIRDTERRPSRYEAIVGSFLGCSAALGFIAVILELT